MELSKEAMERAIMDTLYDDEDLCKSVKDTLHDKILLEQVTGEILQVFPSELQQELLQQCGREGKICSMEALRDFLNAGNVFVAGNGTPEEKMAAVCNAFSMGDMNIRGVDTKQVMCAYPSAASRASNISDDIFVVINVRQNVPLNPQTADLGKRSVIFNPNVGIFYVKKKKGSKDNEWETAPRPPENRHLTSLLQPEMNPLDYSSEDDDFDAMDDLYTDDKPEQEVHDESSANNRTPLGKRKPMNAMPGAPMKKSRSRQ